MKFFVSVILVTFGILMVSGRPQGFGEGGLDEKKDYHHYPKYKYAYGVKDPHTGDMKEAWEHRDGDKVVGEYSLMEPDGTHRVVKYHANDKEGFNAVVEIIGKPHHHKEEQQFGQYKEEQFHEKHHKPAESYQKVQHL
ncbi:cuticle protein 19-like [Culicoides brevitarsis]|uniref:cuticle protein 19-like n=1 Tax=Culicoides brevitarsis TaxID=469753 RepID=UPI00307BFE43